MLVVLPPEEEGLLYANAKRDARKRKLAAEPFNFIELGGRYMEMKQKRGCQSLAVAIIAVLAMLTALIFSVYMIRSINERMNESATSNLLNTTSVIESTLEEYISRDFESLEVVGELYRSGEQLDEEQYRSLSAAMGFEWITVLDTQGNGMEALADRFKELDTASHEEWQPETQGYSDAYLGLAGRLQTTLWVPIYQDGVYLGTVFGNVVLTKYYSANVFTFYNGQGRTYLFDGSGGQWILRSQGTDGTGQRQKDIYSLLRQSGNSLEEVGAFREAVEQHKTGTAIFQFNEEPSYVCFMPLSSSTDWYIVTVIAYDALLKESVQVQRMIQITFVIFCASLLLSAVIFAAWRIRINKEREVDYREKLFVNISANIDSAFLIYEKISQQTAFVSDNVGRLLRLERDWLQADAGHLFNWCGIAENDPDRHAFLSGTLEAPVVREVCVAGELGGESRYIRLELIPADLGQEIAVLADITKDKDIQSSLVDAMQRAEEASRAKNDFLSSMSHDIRTPMNGVIGMTAIAAAHLDDPNRVRDCLRKINEASTHLLSIINEVLDMSQFESGRMELSHEPFNLPGLLQEVLNISFTGIQQKGHELNVHIQPMDHEQVIGDAERLQRVITNLLSNAIKYTPEGGRISLDLRELPVMIQGYGCYELTVRDNGIGMSAEFQKRLFQPFEREDDARTSRIQGTGLGMPIVKNIVSLMMGDIQVESEKHKGSTFRVTLNLRLDEQEKGSDTIASLPVLVVDDDLITCEAVTQMLGDIGMVGEWADNGLDAIQKVAARHQRAQDYMAVLLDWKMPGMDGIETARRIRAKVDASVPIIVLTAYDWSEIEGEARAAGVDSFLSKPVYKAKLRQKMLALAGDERELLPMPGVMDASGIPAGKRILLVEDNELNMEIAKELLQMLGLAVDGAEDGEAAVERFVNSAPGDYDLIMMDIQMPRMNGYEAAGAIRGLNRPDGRTIPIIAMTADTFAQDIQRAHAAGMDDHLGKPISLERLVEVLSRFLSGTERKEGERK